MNCTEVTEQLHLFVDRLDQMPEELVVHIESCKRCDKLYRELIHLDAAIAADGQVPFPPDSYFAGLHEAVMAQIPAQPQQHVHATRPARQGSFWGVLGWRPILSGVFALVLVVAAVRLQPWSLLSGDEAADSSAGLFSDAASPSSSPSANVTAPPPESVAVDETVTLLPPSPAAKEATSQPASQEDPDQTADQGRLRAGLDDRISSPKAGRQATTTAAGPDSLPQGADSKHMPSRSQVSTLAETRAPAVLQAERASSSKVSSVKFESAHKSDNFTASLRAAQNTEKPAQRIEIWKAFLAAERDSTRMEYLMGLSQLSEAIYDHAMSSGELLDLADAVAWYERRGDRLKPLIGEAIFQQRLKHLRESLQAARTRGAASQEPEIRQ